MLERKPSCLTLQVQRANGEELTLQDLPHRPGGAVPAAQRGWQGSGKAGWLHCQPLRLAEGERPHGPNLNAARFPPSVPSPPSCQARTRAGHRASPTRRLAPRAEAHRNEKYGCAMAPPHTPAD